MRPMRPLLCLAVLSLGLLSACALRPYYRQVLPPDMAAMKPQAAKDKGEATVRLLEPETEKPIAGARVIMTLGRGRVVATSDANGLVQLPVTPELLAENPLVEVVLPAGVQGGYAFWTVPVEPEAAPEGESAPQQPQE
ncbi:hypothetical protein NR798_43150 [Archangium gephyra]|uniref:hypothetical protein n=1 Tax=Archangium gephyra TaxID=48 RepID=UPI0035D42C7F